MPVSATVALIFIIITIFQMKTLCIVCPASETEAAPQALWSSQDRDSFSILPHRQSFPMLPPFIQGSLLPGTLQVLL